MVIIICGVNKLWLFYLFGGKLKDQQYSFLLCPAANGECEYRPQDGYYCLLSYAYNHGDEAGGYPGPGWNAGADPIKPVKIIQIKKPSETVLLSENTMSYWGIKYLSNAINRRLYNTNFTRHNNESANFAFIAGNVRNIGYYKAKRLSGNSTMNSRGMWSIRIDD